MKSKLLFSMALLSLIVLSLNGCAPNHSACTKFIPQSKQVSYCSSVSDTGACRTTAYRTVTTQVCVSWVCDQGFYKDTDGNCVSNLTPSVGQLSSENSNEDKIALQGVLAHKAGNLEQALVWFDKAIAHGGVDADSAQYYLGSIYETGNGVPQDYHKAIEWYEKSAELGNEYSAFNLGQIYYNGSGPITLDYTKAFYWNEKAALQGHDEAIYYMIKMHSFGQGTPKNKFIAADWVKVVGMGRNPAVIEYTEGRIRAEGSFTGKDISIAIMHFNDSAKLGYMPARTQLALLGEQGHSTALKYLAMIAEKEKRWRDAKDWYEKAWRTNKTDPFSPGRMADIYCYHIDDPDSVEKSNIWYKRTRELADPAYTFYNFECKIVDGKKTTVKI
jgi:TPR repeat protein